MINGKMYLTSYEVPDFHGGENDNVIIAALSFSANHTRR